jgi:hypothetical protein
MSLKCSFLSFPPNGPFLAHGLVVDAEVARHQLLPVCPERRDEVDSEDHVMVLAAPVARDKLDLLRVGLVQGGVVEDEHPALQADERSRLPPERVPVLE